MEDDSVRLIEAWFAEHDGDGEFVRLPKSAPWTVIAPNSPTASVILTTKPAIVAMALHQSDLPNKLGMVRRYGLPGTHDVSWIRQVVGQGEMLFLGDLDPVDLMVFSWLRTQLQPTPTHYLGINDTFLSVLQLAVPKSHTLASAPSEQAALALLPKILPELPELVGPQCADLLSRGRKIELDAVVSLCHSAAPIVQAALTFGTSAH